MVTEIVGNSQEIDFFLNDINISLYSLKYGDYPEEYDEDRTLLDRKVWDLERSNEDLVNKHFDIMCQVVFNAETKDETIEIDISENM